VGNVEVVVDPEQALLRLGIPVDREGVVAKEPVEDLLVGRGAVGPAGWLRHRLPRPSIDAPAIWQIIDHR